MIESWAQQLIEQYQEVMLSEKITALEAIKRLSKSVARAARSELEK